MDSFDWKDVLEAIPHSALILNEDRDVIYANSKIIDLLGLPLNQLQKKKCYELFHDINGIPIECPVHQILDGKTNIQNDVDTIYGTYLISCSSIVDQHTKQNYIIHLAIDISHRKALENNLVHNQEELVLLLQGARAVLNPMVSFTRTAQNIFNACKKAIGAKSGYVALLSDDGLENEVLFLDSGGLDCDVDEELPMPIRGLRREAYKKKIVVFDNAFETSQWQKFMPEGHVSLENVLFAPLMFEKHVIGLLGIANKPGGFTEHDAKIAEMFGDYISLALINSRNFDKLELVKHSVEYIATPIIWLNEKGSIVYANNAFCEETQYSIDEVLQLSVHDVDCNFPHTSWNAMFMSIKKKSSSILESEFLCKDGTKIPVLLQGKYYQSKEFGERIFVYAVNITDIRLAEQALKTSEKRYREFIETMQDGFLVFKDNRVVYSNQAGCKILKATNRQDLIGKTFDEFIEEKDMKRVYQRIENMIHHSDKTNRYPIEGLVKRLDNKKIYADMLVSPNTDSTDEQIIQVLLRDITQKKKTEFQIKQQAKSLESKNRELETMIYAASHDLRSPVVNIQGFSQELEHSCQKAKKLLDVLFDDIKQRETKQNFYDLINHDVQEALFFIKSSVKRISTLLDGLLQLSRIGKQPIKFEALNMTELVNNIVQSLQYQIHSQHVQIDIEELPPMVGDKKQIMTLITNLIDNAIKYSFSQDVPQIKISGISNKGTVLYKIQDNGIGIHEKYHTKIFELFHRLEPEHVKNGEGIGLTVASQIVEKHNGEIWVESEPGKGSIFYIKFNNDK